MSNRIFKIIGIIGIVITMGIIWYHDNCLDSRSYVPTRVECRK